MTIVGKNENFQSGKSDRAIFGAQNFGSQTPALLSSNVSPGDGCRAVPFPIAPDGPPTPTAPSQAMRMVFVVLLKHADESVASRYQGYTAEDLIHLPDEDLHWLAPYATMATAQWRALYDTSQNDPDRLKALVTRARWLADEVVPLRTAMWCMSESSQSSLHRTSSALSFHRTSSISRTRGGSVSNLRRTTSVSSGGGGSTGGRSGSFSLGAMHRAASFRALFMARFQSSQSPQRQASRLISGVCSACACPVLCAAHVPGHATPTPGPICRTRTPVYQCYAKPLPCPCAVHPLQRAT